MNKKVMIMIIAVVVLLGGAAAAYFLLFAGNDDSEKEVPTYPYVPGEYFVTNIKDSNRLFKVTVVLQVDQDNMDEDLDTIQHIIRDKIITVLRAKTEENLRADDAQQVLAAQLLETLRTDLQMEYLVGIYFNDFVVQ